MQSLTVICPAYNEQAGIAEFHAALREQLNRLGQRYECSVIYVVDRCPDKTVEVLESICATDHKVRVLSLSTRFGHQNSLLAGIDHCDADVLVMMDCDFQHPPELIAELVGKYEQGFDIVQAVRQDTQDISLWRKLLSAGFYWIINRISPQPIEPNAADFRLISRQVAEVFQHSVRERAIFLRGLFNWVGFNKTSVPFIAPGRKHGVSKYSSIKLMSFALSGILSFSNKPLYICFAMGLVLASLGGLHALWMLFDYIANTSTPRGWMTLVMLITLFSGVQLIFLGVIGAYLGAVLTEVKGRPHYIVAKDIGYTKPEQG
jgi:dolichol-phosphate mannosyltransferase